MGITGGGRHLTYPKGQVSVVTIHTDSMYLFSGISSTQKLIKISAELAFHQLF
jgi:hypothetical protein